MAMANIVTPPSRAAAIAPWIRWSASAGVLLVAFWVPAWAGFAAGTLIWAACGLVLVALWPARATALTPGARYTPLRVAVVLGASAAAVWTLTASAARVVPNVFSGPPDPYRADMLVVISAAITRFLAGGNPYVHYQVPWDIAFAYGPMLWLPYVIPHWLQIDLRVLTLPCQLTIPAVFGLAGIIQVARGRWLPAASLLALAWTIAFEPNLLAFHAIGHTQVYWPLLLIFALLLAADDWTACSLLMALLVAARSTMVSMVPVFFLTLRARRELTLRRTLLFAGTLVIMFGPFLVIDPCGLVDAMYGSYMRVVKGWVWHSTPWAVEAFGITGMLLGHGLERYVEAVQLVALAAVYVAAWFRIRAGARPEPWLVLALLTFSMTTLWSVIYIYFDVWLFAAAALMATAWPNTRRRWVLIGVVPLAGFLAACGAGFVAAALRPGS